MLDAVQPVVKARPSHASCGSRNRSSSISSARFSSAVASVSSGRCTCTFWSATAARKSPSSAAGVTPPVTKP